MITHDKCAAFEAKISILEKKLQEAIELLRQSTDEHWRACDSNDFHNEFACDCHVRRAVKFLEKYGEQ